MENAGGINILTYDELGVMCGCFRRRETKQYIILRQHPNLGQMQLVVPGGGGHRTREMNCEPDRLLCVRDLI